MNILDLSCLGGNFSLLKNSVHEKKSCSLFGVQYSLRAPLVSMCSKNILYIVSDYISAVKAKEYFDATGNEAIIFSGVADSFIYKKAQNVSDYINRNLAFFNILTKPNSVIICTADSLLCTCSNPHDFYKNIVKIKTNQIISPNELASMLISAGYRRLDGSTETGTFTIRGEVIDIFALNAKYGVRLDYFDDQLESISLLGENGRPEKNIDNFSICPCTNIFWDDDKSIEVIDSLNKTKRKISDNSEDSIIFAAQIDELISKVENKDKSFNLNVLLGLSGENFSIVDYAKFSKKNFIYAIDEVKIVYDSIFGCDKENTSRIKQLKDDGCLISSKYATLDATEIITQLKNFAGIAFQKLINANRFFNPDVILDFNSKTVGKYVHNTANLAKDLEVWQDAGFKVFLLTEKSNSKKLIKNLQNYDIEYKINNTAKATDFACVIESNYPTGFMLPLEKLVIIADSDLFSKPIVGNKLSASRNDVFSIPKVGDYVVHSVHGIGVCEGVTQLSGNLGTKDYVVVRYKDGDKLFVPTTQMNMLDRFSGAEKPRTLSKIGGVEFEKVKQKVKQSVKKLAFDLVDLYAKRQSIRGYAFSEDNLVQKEFENSFQYTETLDQLVSINEIKKDMQSTKVMDRLLCGDVGFGKTEVAMRAAFKAVLDNKQVAFLAPTTILCQQHYNTCIKRMQEFGVNIEVLNRFKTPKESKLILERLKNHKIDILCSTHRMLSNDVEFADLGLIILDEEQKFGVSDKEKLKNKHKNVDYLTLSATPIPRTLHMSLSGIRDISIISTPPSLRLPVNTYVTEYSPSLVRDAITREKSRGGQTFILYNKVENIYDFATKIRQLVPDCKILVGHGQLPSNVLEEVIYDFYNGKADVLICTTIMENGIDIENANTLIVCNADRFGLSQLYQLRGRVGRGNKLAYAYFTYEYSKTLTEEAYKRLDAISEFTEFGSGFKLAMRDLEIRGSGNVLGAEQHGFLQKVGYDMYAKLLSEAVAEAQGKKPEAKVETVIKINVDAFIPNEYISASEQRLIAYKKISAISNLTDKQSIIEEFTTKLGKPPKEVINLIDIAYLKTLASQLNVQEILCTDMQVYLQFETKENITESEQLGNAIYKYNKQCALEFSDKPKIKFMSLGKSELNYKMVLEFISFALEKQL